MVGSFDKSTFAGAKAEGPVRFTKAEKHH